MVVYNHNSNKQYWGKIQPHPHCALNTGCSNPTLWLGMDFGILWNHHRHTTFFLSCFSPGWCTAGAPAEAVCGDVAMPKQAARPEQDPSAVPAAEGTASSTRAPQRRGRPNGKQGNVSGTQSPLIQGRAQTSPTARGKRSHTGVLGFCPSLGIN